MRIEKVEEQGPLLGSWKEIAAYMGRTIRTCQRLESVMDLPIHRLDGSPKAHVFAYRNELDAWLAQKAGDREQSKRKPRRYVILGLAGLAALALAVVLIKVAGGPRPEAAANSIAVLPFDDMSPPGSEHIAAGITEDITSGLVGIHDLQVSGRTSAAAVKALKLDARKTGRALNAGYLVEGSVQLMGESLRVTARLLDAGNGKVLWAETYDGRKRDLLDVRDGITKSVVERLGGTLLAGEEAALRRRPTADAQAYEYYLTGRYLLGRPWPESPTEALRYFELALRRDPKFALAHVGISWVYMNMISQYLARPNDAGPKAEKAAKEALALAPDLAETVALDAWVQSLYRFDWDAGEKGLARAVELKPRDSMIRGLHAMTLLTQRRIPEARAEIKSALADDPYMLLMPVLSAYSMWIHLYTGGSEEVLEEFRRTQRIQPNFEFAHYGAGMALIRLGRLDEGMKELEIACGFPHTNGRPDAALATAYVMKGDREAAERIYARLLQEYKKSGLVAPTNLAWIRAALGDIDTAFDWLETARREHDPTLPWIHIYAESVLPEVARQPRFQAFLDELRLPH